MINGEEVFCLVAHLALGSEQFFRCRLVGKNGICCDIPESINILGQAGVGATNQATTLLRHGFLCVADYGGQMLAPKLEGWQGDSYVS